MKVTINIDCTPQEARAYMGLPDFTPINDAMVEEMKSQMTANMAKLQPEEMFRSWMALGGQAQEQFMKMMTAGTISQG
jgi:hypothetical protein